MLLPGRSGKKLSPQAGQDQTRNDLATVLSSSHRMTAPHRPLWQRSRYGFAAFFVLSYVAASSLLRVLLFFNFKTAQPAPFGEVCRLFLSGFHRDVFAALALAVPLLAWFLIVPNR